MTIKRLSPARIARSLVTVLVLTLFQTIIPPFANFLTPQAAAFSQGTITNGTTLGGIGGNVNNPTPCSDGAVTGIKAAPAPNGDYSNGFGYTCTSFNSDGSLSSTTSYTQVFVYPSGGTLSLSQTCATGQVGIGVRVNISGNMVREFSLVCGNPMSQGNPTTLALIPNTLTGGTDTTDTCAPGKVLVGFNTKTGNGMDQMTIRCATYTGFVYAPVGAPTITNSGPHSATIAFNAVTTNIADTPETYTVTATSSLGTIETTTGMSSPITISNLRTNVSYSITVSGVNTYGSSAATASASLSLAPTPGGESDTAITTNGTQYAYISNFSNIMPGTVSTYTIEAWIRPDSTCDGAYYCSITTANYGFLLDVYAGKIAYIIGSGTAWCDGGVRKNPTTAAVKSGEWSHVALVRNGANVKIYINGNLRSDITSSCSPTTQTANTSEFTVGYRPSNTEYFYGKIDELRMWSTTRTGSDITSDMYSNETSTSGLLHYWNFNEGSGSVAYNQLAGAVAATDLTLATTSMWDSNSIATTTTSGVYTVQTFYRSFITSAGGWKTPLNLPTASAIVVAGGGGGGWNSGGGGGGGGFLAINRVSLSGAVPIKVGMGGMGALATNAEQTPTYAPTNGHSSIFGSNTVAGGNAGGVFNVTTAGGAAITTASHSSGAGGAGSSTSGVAASNGASGPSSDFSGTATIYSSGGGGGGYNSAGGSAGAGAGAGGGSTTQNTGSDALANRGGGGGASAAHVFSGNGGSGIIIIRWITASKPTFTQPTIAYLNAGMTETFTTNVASDSATVSLTRTFRWESSTTGVNGTYSLIKQGTGAANASFSWVPSDTTTSGSTYAYRVVVTDSDTAGLFIVETSTPVWAIINQPLRVSGATTIPKAINLSKSETFTISLGTSTYRPSLSPTIAGITLDTSTAGFAVIKLAETVTVGTHYETLTVVDSVSASVSLPLAIKVVPPPSFTATQALVDSGTVLYLDAGNSASYSGTGNTWNDLSGRGLTTTLGANLSGFANRDSSGNTCKTSPSYSTDYKGILNFDKSQSQCALVSGIGSQNRFSVETWVRPLATQDANGAIFATPYTGSSARINFECAVYNTTSLISQVECKFLNSTWTYGVSGNLNTGSWNHLVFTYDGSKLHLFINNQEQPTADEASRIAEVTTYDNLFIGRRWDLADYYNGAIASLRVYNRALSSAEVSQNYAATVSRFTTDAQYDRTPTRKYGLKTFETFTVTAGGDSKTSTFAVGNRGGVLWDTTTVSVVKLEIQESLTVGTYNDTVTVTDNLGQITYLPITMKINQADTLTVSMSSGLTTVYTGAVPASAPKASITGLVGVDSATVQTIYTGTTSSSGATCATGGACAIGDVGPGGGYVFYVSTTAINRVTGISDGGIYLEIAPYAARQGSVWSNTNAAAGGTLASVGSGAANTDRIITQLGSNGVAATAAAAFTYGGKSDWFLPSTDELYQAYLNLKVAGLGDLDGVNYWSSTEVSGQESSQAYNYWMGNNNNSGATSKSLGLNWRAIRAFSPTLLDSTTAPIDVDTYTATGGNLTFSTGALSNYVNVVYETSTLKITQSKQNKLTINYYGAIAGSPFIVVTTGGSGPGAVTETTTVGSSATNCNISNHVLTNSNSATDQKFCRIIITKAASRNYLVETLTADVYFMVFANNQPINQVGSGPTIGINGKTSLAIDDSTTVTAPNILSWSLSGNQLTITGVGFGSSQVTVEFFMYQDVTATPTGGGTQIVVSVPVGAITGPVSVIKSPGGIDSIPELVLP